MNEETTIISGEISPIQTILQYRIAKFISKNSPIAESKILDKFKKFNKQTILDAIEFLYDNSVIELAQNNPKGEHIYQLDDWHGEQQIFEWEYYVKEESRKTQSNIQGWITAATAILALIISALSLALSIVNLMFEPQGSEFLKLWFQQ